MATSKPTALQQTVRITTLTHFMSEHSKENYRKRFPWYVRTFASLSTAVDLPHVQRLHWSINRWTKEGALSWKQSKMATFGATAVAGAIFASAGVTALQLNDSANSNWIARAFFLYSTVMGVGCVMMSTYMHNRLSEFDTHEQVRFYLSRGLSKMEESEKNSILVTLPLESSVAASMLLDGPARMLIEAAGFFLTGLLLLYLLQWIGRGPTPDDDRNIFVFNICVFVYYGFWIILASSYIVVDHQRWKAQFIGNDEDIDPNSQPSRNLASLRHFWAAMDAFAKDPLHNDPDIDTAIALLKQPTDEAAEQDAEIDDQYDGSETDPTRRDHVV